MQSFDGWLTCRLYESNGRLKCQWKKEQCQCGWVAHLPPCKEPHDKTKRRQTQQKKKSFRTEAILLAKVSARCTLIKGFITWLSYPEWKKQHHQTTKSSSFWCSCWCFTFLSQEEKANEMSVNQLNAIQWVYSLQLHLVLPLVHTDKRMQSQGLKRKGHVCFYQWSSLLRRRVDVTMCLLTFEMRRKWLYEEEEEEEKRREDWEKMRKCYFFYSIGSVFLLRHNDIK